MDIVQNCLGSRKNYCKDKVLANLVLVKSFSYEISSTTYLSEIRDINDIFFQSKGDIKWKDLT